MNDVSSDRASEQGRFAAREFLARWKRETGEVLSPANTDRMLFAYEMGYLRGRSDATQESMKMFDDVARLREETSTRTKKENADDDDEAK